MFGRRNVATLVAEFLGTGVLTLLILSVQRSTIGVPFFVALGAGLTLALMVAALGNISGSHLNPAVTIGMWTARRISTLNGVLYIAAQLLGAWAAYYLYVYFVKVSLQPIGGHFAGRILVAEAVGTAIFTFGWAAAVYQRVTPAATAAVVGLAYMVGIIAASPAAIGLLNPAVALGARAWVWGTYVLGPVLGAIIGINLYGLLFAESTRKVKAASATAAPAAKAPAKKRTTKRAKK
ncbi:MAG TPA: aquaporin [Candidatus Dormibacteraeota bacterium]|nr:aquaporin [Candidatus Dormibacteraeota bacterium]